MPAELTLGGMFVRGNIMAQDDSADVQQYAH
jgi:hypothetical protein